MNVIVGKQSMNNTMCTCRMNKYQNSTYTKRKFSYPQRTCAARVGLSVCLSVLKLACSKFIPSTNGTTYLTHNKGVNFYEISSETAPLQSQSPSGIVRLLCESATFH